MIAKRDLSLVVAAAASLCAVTPAEAISFTDLASYNAAVGPHPVITFEGLSDGEIVTNQFAGLGATFTDGDDTVSLSTSFVVDGVGINDNGSTEIVFSSPMDHFGVEFPGAVTIELYDGQTLIDSEAFGGAGTGFFGGLLEPGQTFDRVVLFDHFFAPGFYDNLHFGRAIPEPASLAALAGSLALTAATRRRR